MDGVLAYYQTWTLEFPEVVLEIAVNLHRESNLGHIQIYVIMPAISDTGLDSQTKLVLLYNVPSVIWHVYKG